VWCDGLSFVDQKRDICVAEHDEHQSRPPHPQRANNDGPTA
jgi:hypothetical protein